jgi:HlyD family secretion protein
MVAHSGSRLNVGVERLTISSVEKIPFQEYIALVGTVLPIRTVYLDAMEGGRVEAVVGDAGSYVAEGDTILSLSNTSLVLDIMNREAQIFEQRNNLRNSRLAMQQNALDLEAQLLDLERRLQVVKRRYVKNRRLLDQKLIPRDEFDDSEEEYEYLLARHDLTIRTQQQDSTFRHLQIGMLEDSLERLETNLNVVRQKLANLCLLAPVSGQLTSLNAEVGESKSRGERLGQIDILDGFKVRLEVDEYYIARLSVGLEGTFELAGRAYELRVAKIYPEVSAGRFPVDMEFAGGAPHGMRRGQTLHVRLALGDPTECLVLPRGGFYATTSGRWVFVLDESGDRATRRYIRLGRQNARMFEVLEGLNPGEQVITSPYDEFGDADRLALRN